MPRPRRRASRYRTPPHDSAARREGAGEIAARQRACERQRAALGADTDDIDAEQRRPVLHDDVERLGAGARRHHGEHRALRARLDRGVRPARREQRLGPVTQHHAALALGLEHRRHVVGETLAVHAPGRRQRAIERGPFGKEIRMRAQEGIDEGGLVRVRLDGAGPPA